MAVNGAVIAGRGSCEAAGRWGGRSPWRIPVFIVTHRLADRPPGGGFISPPAWPRRSTGPGHGRRQAAGACM
jgi:hypothetical protein